MSARETAAIVTAMVECMRYALHKHKENKEICEYIIHEQVFIYLLLTNIFQFNDMLS